MKNYECVENLEENIAYIDSVFHGCGDIVKKRILCHRKDRDFSVFLIYVDGLTDSGMIEDVVLRPLLHEDAIDRNAETLEEIFRSQIETVDIEVETSFDQAIYKMLRGDTAIFVDGYKEILIVSSKSLPVRGIESSTSEVGLRGPRDSFNESIRSTTALIRRRIRDPRLKVEQGVIGERSKSDYALLYMEDLVSDELLLLVKDRLSRYIVDGVFDVSMVEQLLLDGKDSIFPIVQATQRPDKTASGILEGRICIALDNSPEVLLVPATLNTFLQASDDYYNRFFVATFSRVLRYIAMFIAISLSGFYVAVTMYHPAVLPTELLLVIVRARSEVPFPILIEVLIMELLFELLREAGIRLPGQMGNTIGIVGGLIVGQAAVEAGLVSTIVVITTALSAIASFSIPNESFVSSFRLLKFAVLFSSAFFGLYGFSLIILFVLLYVSTIDSFGYSYLSPFVKEGRTHEEERKDFILKYPFLDLKMRPGFARENARVRMKKAGDRHGNFGK